MPYMQCKACLKEGVACIDSFDCCEGLVCAINENDILVCIKCLTHEQVCSKEDHRR